MLYTKAYRQGSWEVYCQLTSDSFLFNTAATSLTRGMISGQIRVKGRRIKTWGYDLLADKGIWKNEIIVEGKNLRKWCSGLEVREAKALFWCEVAESTQSGWDFSRVWELSPKVVSLNGRNIVACLLSGRFPLCYGVSEWEVRDPSGQEAKPQRSKTLNVVGFLSLLKNHMASTLGSLTHLLLDQTLASLSLKEGQPKMRRKFFKSTLFILLFYNFESYFIKQVKTP